MHAGSPSALSSRKLSLGLAATVKSVLLSTLSSAASSLPSCPGGYSDVRRPGGAAMQGQLWCSLREALLGWKC